MTKINKIGISILMLILLSFNVLGLSFILEQGVSSTLPICNNNQFLLYSSGNWTCTDYTSPSGFDLTCNNGEITVYNTSTNDWECAEYPNVTGGSFDLTCSNGQTTIYNGSDWVCYTLPTVNTIYNITCSQGQILEYDTINGWECGTDSTGSDDQTLYEVLTQGNTANGQNITDVNYFNLTGTFRQGSNGNMFIYDINDELHHVNVDLERFDEIRVNTFTTDLDINTFTNATGTYINITGEGTRISFIGTYLNESVSESFPNNNYILELTEGTNATPILNRVYAYIDDGVPTWAVSITEPTIPHAMASRVLVGDGVVYVASLQEDADNGFLKRVQRRFRLEGLLYTDGFDYNATATNLEIGTGSFLNGVYDGNSLFDLDTATEFYLILNNGSYVKYNSFDDIVQYSSGETIGTNKYFNVVFGVTPFDHSGRIFAVVQDKPIVEYTSTLEAYGDSNNVLRVFPSDNFLKNYFLPVSRMILNKGNGANLLPNGLYAVDYRGGIFGGSSSGGGLNELDPVFSLWLSNYFTGNYYNKTEVYNISEIDGFFLNYYLKTEVYNKTEIDTKINLIEGTYLYNKTCGNNEYLRFNTTINDWDCVTISLSGSGEIGENITVKNIQLEYTNITSIQVNTTFAITDPSVIIYINMSSTEASGGLIDQIGTSTQTAGGGVAYSGTFTAFDFDGTNDQVATSYTPNNGAFTFSIWFKFDAFAGDDFLASTRTTGDGMEFDFTGNTIRFTLVGTGGSNYYSYGFTDTTNFHLLTMSWDGTTRKCYIDGTLVNSSTPAVGTVNHGRSVVLGSRNGANFFDGKLSNFIWLNTAISDADVSEIYSAGRNINLVDTQFYEEGNLTTNYTYFGDKISATGYVTRTPQDKMYNKLNKKIDTLDLSINYRDEDGKLNKDLIFENEKVLNEVGSYYVDAVADNNRIMILELIEEKNKIIEENNFIKNEMCLYDKKYSWCLK